MDPELRYDLIRCETDIDGAMNRLGADEKLYVSCLYDFLSDSTMADLEETLNTRSWDDAFTAAHALKGLAGNMGFIPLFHASAEMVILIRNGKVKEVYDSYRALQQCYKSLTEAIGRHCADTRKGELA